MANDQGETRESLAVTLARIAELGAVEEEARKIARVLDIGETQALHLTVALTNQGYLRRIDRSLARLVELAETKLLADELRPIFSGWPTAGVDPAMPAVVSGFPDIKMDDAASLAQDSTLPTEDAGGTEDEQNENAGPFIAVPCPACGQYHGN